MVMNTSWRDARQFLGFASGGSSGKGPEVAGVEPSSRGAHIESNGDSVFQDEHGARGGNGDVRATLRINVPPDRGAIFFVHFARLIPAANAGVAIRVEGAAEHFR